MKAARFFSSGAAFRVWLEAHHDRETELLVGFFKKSRSANASRSGGNGAREVSRSSMTYQEALDEALAFGWIDGVRRSIDTECWSIRFTPRTARSIWSNINIRHVERLIAGRRMAAPGLRAFEARSTERSGIYSFERKPMTFDAPSKKALAGNKKAKTFFDAQPPGYRRVVTYWVMSAKKPETRARRLARLVRASARGVRIDLMKPNA